MTDDEMTMHISIAVGALETCRYYEAKAKPKGARTIALNRLIDSAMKVVDMYKLNAWDDEKLRVASRVLDDMENRIRSAFNPKLVTRDTKGRYARVNQ